MRPDAQLPTLITGGGPSAAVLVGPNNGAALGGPGVRFQWQSEASKIPSVRYEICVRLLNQPCSNPGAAIFRPTGVLLTEPLPPARVNIGAKPGEPGFERPAGGSGTPPFFLQAQLPIHFQGRRLHWSVTTCAPVQRTIAMRAPIEACTESAPRAITYLLPLPVLAEPAPDLLLANLTPRFRWSHPNLQGVEQFLICIAARGAPCPAAPTLQAHVFVAPVQGGFEFTAPKDFAPFMGQTLQWTVAVCNAELGCSYQPAARRFRVPVLDGSLDSIYEVAQNAKCKNCHQMRDGNATYETHVRLGRFTRALVPPDQVGNSSLCQGCHTAASGFADGWRAPTDTPSFDVPISATFCSVMQSAPYFSTVEEHLYGDRLILWAVARMPGVGVQAWGQKVSAWLRSWKRTPYSSWETPCVCQGKWDCGGRAHGQFTP